MPQQFLPVLTFLEEWVREAAVEMVPSLTGLDFFSSIILAIFLKALSMLTSSAAEVSRYSMP